MNGNMSKEGITKDLEAMKAVGLAGFHQFDAGLEIPPGPVAYNSTKYHELMAYTFAEAERLGLRGGVHNSSGWSSTGGPWITPENSMKTLIWSEVKTSGGDTNKIVLKVPEITKIQQKGKPPEKYDFYRDVVVLAFPTPKDDQYRIENWAAKSLTESGARTEKFITDLRAAPPESIVPSAQVLNLSDRMDASGNLTWTPPSGDWTVLRIGYTTTGVVNHPASKAGQGLEVDKLSRKAIDIHWDALIKKIIADAGGKRSMASILVDSFEVGAQNWTESFNQEFQKRRGYDLLPQLLCLTGRVMDDTETTERVLWDLRRTVAELMQENYFAYFAEKCRAHGLEFALEPYGNGTFDASATTFTADLPLTEFWQEKKTSPLWQWTTQVVASGAHLSGHSVVGAESFTAIDGDWTDTPANLKSLGDWAFAKGVNRYYFHTTVHQSMDDSIKPGMTFSRFGGNFHRNNTWYLKCRAWMDYIARCQFILQQGSYQADVLGLYGDDRAFDNLPTPKEPLGLMNLPGLNADLGGMTSLNDLSVEPNGDLRVTYKGKLLDTRYKLLLVQRGELMLPQNVALLGELADKGAKIYAPRPLRSPSFGNHAEADKTIQTLVKRYWDSGLIHEAKEFSAASKALTPDCEAPDSILFNHHRDGATDFYFISNQQATTCEITAKFRISGKQPELWNPVTGEITTAPNWQALPDGRTAVSLSLTESDSVFVVFRKPTKSQGQTTPKLVYSPLVNLSNPWKVTFDPKWGPKEPVTFDQLTPLNENSNDEIKHFSGTAVYHTTFDLAQIKSSLVLDLGKVEVLARVTLNGKDLGTLWKPPFRVDISQAAIPGKNQLEVEVTDLWVNRLIGDAALPDFDAKTRQEILAGKPLPADAPRQTFLVFKRWKKTDKLVPSGLIGPVVIEQQQ